MKGHAYPAGIWCENDVGSTSMRRHHVASTLIRRHFGTKCPLGTCSHHFYKRIGILISVWFSLHRNPLKMESSLKAEKFFLKEQILCFMS